MRPLSSLAVALTLSSGLAAYADTVTDVSLTTYYNGSWSTEINGAQIAAAPKTGSTGTGITFADYNGNSFLLSPTSIKTISTGSVALNSNAVVRTLFNTYFGAATTEAVLTFTNSAAQTATYSLVADQTIRDYNNDGFPNGLSGSNTNAALGSVTAEEWWNNGGNGQRLDVQSFLLPTAWNGTSLVSIQIANPGSSGADDILSAVQVDDRSNGTAITPEPSGFVLLGTGILGMAGALRMRLKRKW